MIGDDLEDRDLRRSLWAVDLGWVRSVQQRNGLKAPHPFEPEQKEEQAWAR